MAGTTSTHGATNRRIQVRAANPRAFTEAKRQVFLDHLAACCNVKRAAAAAGVHPVTVGKHRRQDPGFATQCAEALDAGFDTIMAALMEKAAGTHYQPGPDADTAPGPERLDAQLLVQLLALRGKWAAGRRAPGPPPGGATETELNDAILAKLALLDARIAAGRPVGHRGRRPAARP